MIGGIQKWALVAYIVLCVFLLSRPSPEKLQKRADALDLRLSGADKAALAPALASALDLSEDSLQAFIQNPASKPSSLVFQKLLPRCDSENCEESPANELAKAGMRMDEAVVYFDSIEERILARISIPEPSHKNSSKSLTAKPTPPEVHGAIHPRSKAD